MSRGEMLLAESRRLSDEQLLRELHELSARERAGLVRILARLSVLGERELAQKFGFPSIFLFCARSLRYCEGTAFNRAKAAEAGGRFPFLLDLVEDGELSVTALAKLSSVLTQANCRHLAREARGKTTREVEQLVASLAPRPQAPRERVAFVAVRKGAPATVPPRPVPAGEALQPALSLEAPAAAIEIRTQRTFTCGEEVEALLSRAKELLWHKYPQGRLEDILRDALEALLRRVDPARRVARPGGARDAAGGRSRHIPRRVRVEVDRRDGDRCAFIGADGRRCPERRGLEYDHIKPWALGGRSDDPDNIVKHCRSHNQWRARRQFGKRCVSRR